MTEAFLIVENALLKEEVLILKAQVSACNHVLEMNLKELLRDNWRSNQEVFLATQRAVVT